MLRRKRLMYAALALAAMLLAGGATQAAWKTVTVDLESPDGKPEVVKGTALAYGWYVRDFTPKGVKDKLQIDRKKIHFQDRDLVIKDLQSIEFDQEMDKTTGVRVPTWAHFTLIRPGTSEIVKVDRMVSELQGFGGPMPIVLVITTSDGEKQVDLTPPLDEAGRKNYRPVLRLLFE